MTNGIELPVISQIIFLTMPYSILPRAKKLYLQSSVFLTENRKLEDIPSLPYTHKPTNIFGRGLNLVI